MGALTIGEYRDGDLVEIMAIERDAYPTPWTEAIFRNEITSPLSRMLVARTDQREAGGVAGYVVYWRIADETHLHNLAVRPDMRRKGIAFRLLGEAIRRSCREGARRATLEVRRSNLPARQMYEKFGFAMEGIRPGYYTDTGEDALILWAELSPVGAGEGAAGGAGEASHG